jgi:chlorophyll(ide) b reductase
VITGAAGGVGYAYADEFLASGLKVVICDISPKIKDAEAALRAKHPGAQASKTC